jgi:two-component system response regulator YesN
MADNIRERTAAFLEETGDLHYFFSLGRIVSHLSQIHQVYHEAYRAASSRFFLSPDRVVKSDRPIHQLLARDNPKPIDTDEALQKGNLRSIWENFMRTGTLQEAEDFVEDAFSSIGEANASSILFLNYLTMDCYFSMVRFLRELGRDPDEVNKNIGDINVVIGALTSSEDAKKYLVSYLEEVIRQRDSSTSSRNDQIIETALSYIDSNFTDGSMSLQTTAAFAGLSPNRFSTLFSHEMGMTFIEYLIGKRMERACELLMTTDMKGFEIAYASGYNDPHYFSSTFKKLKGMSPMEYRKRGETEA